MAVTLGFGGVESAVELVEAVIAFLISYFAFKSLRMTAEKSMLYFQFGFASLGTGLLTHGLGTAYRVYVCGLYSWFRFSLGPYGYSRLDRGDLDVLCK